MLKNKTLPKIIIGFLCMIFITSCATTVRFNVTRPGELDLNGAKTISVLPFKPYAYYELGNDASGAEKFVYSFFQLFDKSGPEEKRSLEYLQDRIQSGLANSPYISLVNSDSVLTAIKKGYIIPADVYLTGEVTYFDISDDKTTEKVLVKKGDPKLKTKDQYDYVDKYTRRVRMDIKYQVVDSANDSVLSYNSVSIDNKSSKYNSKRDLPSGYSVIESNLSSTASRILKELQPYVITRDVTLLKIKDKKNEAFKEADKLAKNGQVVQSYEMFASIYQSTALFEAGYNAAMLQLALGNLSVAQKLMNDLYTNTNDSKAAAALEDINREIKLAKKLKKQTAEKELSLD